MTDKEARIRELGLSRGKEIDFVCWGKTIKATYLGNLTGESDIALGTEEGRVLIYISPNDIQKIGEQHHQRKGSNMHFINIDSIMPEHAEELGLVSSIYQLN